MGRRLGFLITHDPTDPELLRRRVQAYTKLGQLDKAAAANAAADKLAPAKGEHRRRNCPASSATAAGRIISEGTRQSGGKEVSAAAARSVAGNTGSFTWRLARVGLARPKLETTSVGRTAASSAGERIAASSAETTAREQIVAALAQADQTVCHRKWCRTNWAARKQKNCFGWLTSRLRMPTEFPPPLLGLTGRDRGCTRC